MAVIVSGGLRVRLFPQPPFADGGVGLETVALRLLPGAAGPGPSDDRLTVCEPSVDVRPYGRSRPDEPLRLPPWTGPETPRVPPSAGGHFDHVPARDPAFRRVHLWGCVRFAMDVWEGYLGSPIPWHFARDFDRLELSLIRDWENAQMGWGYLQTGERTLEDGRRAPLAFDFDIVSHEFGHALLLSLGRAFSPDAVSGEYAALHEASADWAALVAALHFDSVRDELLETTSGDLDGFNRLARFAEFSRTRQVRQANNRRVMADFRHGWTSEHALSEPLMGAWFDAFVDVYHDILVAAGAIPPALEALADRAERDPGLRPRVREGFRRAFDRAPDPFREALAAARDATARVLLAFWRRVEPERFSFAAVPGLMRAAEAEATNGRLRPHFAAALAARGIGRVAPGPRLRGRGPGDHLLSARTAAPD